jgi:hypothetical protein
LVSLLCQLIDPRLELLQYHRRLIRCREPGLRRFGSLVVGAGRQLVSEVTFQVRLLGRRRDQFTETAFGVRNIGPTPMRSKGLGSIRRRCVPAGSTRLRVNWDTHVREPTW